MSSSGAVSQPLVSSVPIAPDLAEPVADPDFKLKLQGRAAIRGASPAVFTNHASPAPWVPGAPTEREGERVRFFHRPKLSLSPTRADKCAAQPWPVQGLTSTEVR